jgi:hypothetical protein
MMRATHTFALIAAAVGVPYAASETEFGRNTMQSLNAKTASLHTAVIDAGDGTHSHRDVERILEKSVDRFRYASTPLAVAGAAGMPSAAGVNAVQPTAVVGVGAAQALSPALTGTPAGGSLVGGPIHDLREVLRFDITPDWVTSRFSRVTTVLAETELEGLRVPVVTGIGPGDLAGSITYYFDYSGKLQRVMLHAFTGDVSRVVETMTQHYGLQAEPTLDAGVYTRRWNGRPVHFVRLTRAPVVYSDALHHKFTVYVELNQPDLRYGISDEAQRIIRSDRGTGRW